MAALTTAALIASATIAAGSAYTQYKSGKEAAKASKEQARIGANQARIEQSGNRRQQIREERLRRARILQGSENTGVGGSSGAFGSIGAMQSITGSNVASSFQADRTSGRLNALSSSIASAQQRASTAAAVGQLSGTVFQSLGGAPALMDTFNPSTPGTVTPYTQGQQQGLFNNTAFVKNM